MTTSQQNRFLPTTETDRKQILDTIGVSRFEDLLQGIPQENLLTGDLKIAGGYSELELRNQIEKIFSKSRAAVGGKSFLGAGVYDHFCPSVVNQLTLRGEFLTSYTPYQPEISQGSLQALFEFQSMVSEVFQMDVSNASHYDGATSCAEACLMAVRIQKNKKTLLVSKGLHPEYLMVIRTYTAAMNLKIIEIPLDTTGKSDEKFLRQSLNDDVACVVAQSPNFFGCVEDMETLCAISQKSGALFCANVTDPLSLGILPPPGEYNADIATGEGQSFGLPQSFGGPYLGLFATRSHFVRQIPGRLCGETVDAQGKRSYTLTLSTREQHIRREKATSNICTNQNLCALWATIWLTLVSKQGFVELAELNFSKSEYLKEKLCSIPGVKLRYNSPTFHEFTLDLSNPAQEFFERCQQKGMAPGVPLSRFWSEDKTGLLVNVTEKKTRDDLDALVEIFQTTIKG